MHRTKTRFAARVNHVATALEGGRCTGHVHAARPRSLRTGGSRRRYASSRPELDDVQRRVLAELGDRRLLAPDVRGASSGNGAWSEIESQAARFVADTEGRTRGRSRRSRVRAGRSSSFVSTATARRSDSTTRGFVRVPRTDARPREHLPRVVVEARVRRHVVLRPAAADEARVASQRWHRDFNDKHLLKAFLYLVDVDEGTGPFQYVPGSAPGGTPRRRVAVAPARRELPARDELEQRLPAEDFKTFTGPKGTLSSATPRFPPRRLRDREASRPHDGDLLIPGVARLADRAQLPVLRITRGLDPPTRFALT